ncbi:MAG: serine/threonine protein kinase [Planctomycetaceae bacterium]|nr:serine/threonine protein kinase [Planctomycetaceae bacterium]
MTNLTQQQLDELAKLLENNQATEVESYLDQIFNAATDEPKHVETLHENSPLTDAKHLETLQGPLQGEYIDNSPTLQGDYATDNRPESLRQTRGQNRQADLADADMANRFGDYELLSEIARGGMGVVYKARQIALNREVAIKMILSGQFANDDEMERFYAEAEAAASLNHPNIVTIYEIGEVDGRHFFSMEYVPGDSLADLVRERPLAPRRAANYISGVCEAVHLAHDNGILHRDIKPANVLVNKKDIPLVTDFGLAKQVHEKSGMTMEGSVLGTPSYMPPEQARGNLDEVDTRSDIYAIGATLYQLLTGNPPFAAASVYETIRQVLNKEPTNPQDRNPDIPQDLSTICMKCLQKSPDKRYQSALELQEELQRFLQGMPILARPIGNAERLTRWCLRNRLIASSSAAAILGVLAMLITMTVAYFVTNDALLDARKSFERSKQTVDDFFVVVTQNELLQTPNTREVREVMLDKALQYYESLRNQRAGSLSDERTFLADSADLEFKIGQIAEAQDNTLSAIAHYDNAATTVQTLLEQSDDDQEQLQVNLSSYLTPLVRIHTQDNTDNFKRASVLSKQVRNYRQAIHTGNPTNLEYARLFANACMNVGTVLVERKIYSLGEQSYEQAQIIRQQILESPTIDASTTLTVQRDLSKGYYQLAELKRRENSEDSFEQAEQYLNLALVSLQAMQDANGDWNDISEDDHLQAIRLLNMRLSFWAMASMRNLETKLNPLEDLKHGARHIAELADVMDRPAVTISILQFQQARLEIVSLGKNRSQLRSVLYDISILLDAHRQQTAVAKLLPRFRWTSLNLLSQHEESYSQFVASLEATMDNLVEHCQDYDDAGDAPLLTEDWTTAWGFMCLTAGEVAQHMLVDLAHIAQEDSASKPKLLKIVSWLQRIQSVHHRMAQLIESVPEEATAEVGYLVSDRVLESVDDLTRQLNTAAAQFTNIMLAE